MTSFKTFWQVVNRYKGTIILYTVMLIAFGGINFQANKETIEFFRELKSNRPNLTAQQYKTIKGQAVKGNVMDARKGLHKVLKRRNGR